jgi:hypothetical protein
MTRIAYVLACAALALAACGTSPPAVPTATFTAPPPPTPSLPAPSEPAPQPVLWLTYTNPTYGYSLEHPDSLAVGAANDDYVELGPKIVVSVWDKDPAAPLGDGPVNESVTDVELAGYPARLFTGYIGSIGGYVPQQFRRYVIERNGVYWMITLYALGLHASGGDLSPIVELDPADVQLFETIAASVSWP